LLGIAAFLVFGLLMYPVMVALVWSGRGAIARRMRWPVTALAILFMIAVIVLLVNENRR
jgi:hypothetical protein